MTLFGHPFSIHESSLVSSNARPRLLYRPFGIIQDQSSFDRRRPISMDIENIYRDGKGRLKLPYGDLAHLLHAHGIKISSTERPAIENLTMTLNSILLLSKRLEAHLRKFGKSNWSDVHSHGLFLDTQSVFLFFRQFMEDVSFLIRAVLPNSIKTQMSPKFTNLVPRIIESSADKYPALAEVFPDTDPLRQFLYSERNWFSEAKDIRDDISHRSFFDQRRIGNFPGLLDLIRSAGGVATFASAEDLRSYLGGLFRRWLALACLSSDFVRHRIRSSHPSPNIWLTDGFIVRSGEIDSRKTSKEPEFPVGTAVHSAPSNQIDALEYFINHK